MANIGLAYVYEAMEDYKKAIDLFKMAIDLKKIRRDHMAMRN